MMRTCFALRLPLALALAYLLNSACSQGHGEPKPRLSMFVGVDVSGSFVNGGSFDDAMKFMAHYIYSHLHGLGDLEVPNVLFVGSIGGASDDEPKTFYPIQTFAGRTVEEIETKLHEIFPRDQLNPYTDYNAFFRQIALTVKNRNLVLRPISVVMLSDGMPDVRKEGKADFSSINLKPLEKLSRNVTLRLLYTSAVVGINWQTRVKRRRVRIWTQDDEVMRTWQDSTLYMRDTPLQEQDKFLAWVADNVDFGVRAQRVN